MNEAPPLLPTASGKASRYSLPAALVQERGFTWACAGVTAGFVSLNLAGVHVWTCPFLQVTGLPCPGCGMTRSCSSLLRGDLAGSLSWHLFGPLFLLIGLTGFTGSLLPQPHRSYFAGWLLLWDRRLRFTPLLFAGLIIYCLTRWFLPR